ncbi:putative Ig domain-containing protein [Roseibacillus persicicus]|uniref:putative Ig domain-containing protein n=1 Tax=Roseibacillus persicicus TaxID=454148 RepID=UPI00280DE288|nr:putative Ig domain-containing protein [Roseibacillus persicicus]MDQ8189550.1 trypsin-like peptidase domain-containing protein [Roseibacillus persicicus]
MRRLSALFLLLIGLAVFLSWPRSQSGSSISLSEAGRKSPTAKTSSEADRRAYRSYAAGSGPSEVSRLELPAPDIDALLAEAKERDAKKLPFRFATPIPINRSSSQLAEWKFENGYATWELEISAPQAESLNFAFRKYHMPPGGKLTLQAANSEEFITFTSRDNDEHGELWTPILTSDTVRMAARVPLALLSEVRLSLGAVNYGFRKQGSGKIGGDLSGNCNVDVVCDASDLPFGAMIEAYRDQIRSVGAYTLNGLDTCTGALINNVEGDCTPYFLTAAHCGITQFNSPSVVVYWNFENSTCRQPGSVASGSAGDGDLTVFNSGAILRAKSGSSDMCLIELDDPVNPDSGAYFAGWNRSPSAPSEAVGIHHPRVAEKRISFEFDPLTITDYYEDTTDSNRFYLRVAAWDHGTTEQGSSGSPLFDGSGRIVGQLYGGLASCNTSNRPDWYGHFYRSWTGGGSPSSQLSTWLAPDGSSPMTWDGRDLEVSILVDEIAVVEGDSGTTTATLEFELSQASSEPVSFTIATAGGSATAGLDYLDPGSQSITITPPQTSATMDITINPDSEPEENERILFAFSNISGACNITEPFSLVIANDDFITPEISGDLNAGGNVGSSFLYQTEALNTPTSYSLTGQPAGMSVDTQSGEISWPSPILGEYTFTLTAANPAGSDSETFTVIIEKSLLKFAFEVPLSVDMTGDADLWMAQTEESFDGEDAIALANTDDSSNTALIFTVDGPDELTFWWKASTEHLFDTFSCSLDTSQVASISGETGWHPVSLEIPAGTHTITYRLVRDDGADGGENTVWLDRFTLRSLADPVFTQPTTIPVESGTESAILLSTHFPNNTIDPEPLPNGWFFQSDSHLRGAATAPFDFTATSTNSTGTSSRLFTVSPFSPSTSLETALDLSGMPVRNGSPGFAPQASLFITGGSAARSAEIGDEQRAEMSAFVMGPGTLRFHWLVSSEGSYDLAYTLVNGRQIAARSGTSSWTEVTVPLEAGRNEVTWLYLKDESISENEDAVFIDNIRLDGYAKWVIDQGLSPFSLPPGSGIDGDDNPGLTEYAVGLSPNLAEPTHAPEWTGSRGDFTLSTPLNDTAVDVTIQLQRSSDLTENSWLTLGEVSDPTTSILSVSDSSADPESFYRLRIITP